MFTLTRNKKCLQSTIISLARRMEQVVQGHPFDFGDPSQLPAFDSAIRPQEFSPSVDQADQLGQGIQGSFPLLLGLFNLCKDALH